MISKPARGSLVNPSHPLARGLVGAWLMNEILGEVVCDLSGRGNNGTFTNGPLWSSDA